MAAPTQNHEEVKPGRKIEAHRLAGLDLHKENENK
jgi:hypothetical protein